MTGALAVAFAGSLSTMVACAVVDPPPIVDPPQTVPPGPPTVRPEPTGLPEDPEHPVTVHDCDTESGYEVTRWLADPPLESGSEAHLLAVYQTSSDHSFRYHPTGAADVYVHRADRPLVLVFSAYEPVRWRVHADATVRIERVVLYGYHPQQVAGVPEDTPVMDRSGEGQPRPDYAAGPAHEYVAEDAGARVESVTGCYDAATFSLH